MFFTKTIAFLILILMTARPAFALDEIYSPNVDYRELSLEYNGNRSFDPQATKNNAQGHELALEAGIMPFWVVSTSAGFTKDPQASTKLNSLEIENRFQFSESGENWIDSGLLVAYNFSMQGHQADSLEIKALLQKDTGMITTTANIGFTQAVGSSSPSGGLDYVLLGNMRYRYNEYVQPGIEVQSDFGQARNLGNFSQQQHYMGPAAYGKLLGHVKYQVAYLAGVTEASAQSAARVLLEYETHF